MYLIENKLCYIAHPNTGSRATRTALQRQLDAKKIGHHHGFNKEIIEKSEGCFCTIRNPWELMVSWWYRGACGSPFEEWLKYKLEQERHFEGLQHAEGRGLYYGLGLCTHVARFERLEDTINEILLTFNIPKVILQREGVTKGKPSEWWKTYTPHTERMVRNEYGPIIKLGGYTCGPEIVNPKI